MSGSPGVSEGRLCAHVRALWSHSTGTWNLLRGDLASACMHCDVSLNVDVHCRYEHILMRNIITSIFIAFRASVSLSIEFQLLHVSESSYSTPALSSPVPVKPPSCHLL